MNEFKQVGNDVIRFEESNYLTRITSSASILRKIIPDDKRYSLTTTDVEIQLLNGNVIGGTLITICSEAEEERYYYMDILISDVIGSFVSDWY